MLQCILCLGGTRENKLIQLSELVNETLTLEDAIRQQITYADAFLINPTIKRVTCTTCFRVFKTFYQLLEKIHQNQNFNLQIPIKCEVDDVSDALNISTLYPEEPQVDIKQLVEIKVEPEFIEERNEKAESRKTDDDDFEWEMDESTVWNDDDNENEVQEKEEEEVTRRSRSSKRYTDPVDSDYEPKSTRKTRTAPTNYIRYLKRSEVTPEMIATGMKSVMIDGLEFRIPKKVNKKSEPKSETDEKSLSIRTKTTLEGDERLKKFMEIKCELCGADFPSFLKLGKHFRRIHPDTEPFLRCCGRKFYRRLVLLDHLDSHDETVVHKCEECNKVYKTDKILKVHIDKIHKNKYRESICNVCGKTLKSSGALKKHLIVHEEDSRQFECYICKKSKYKNLKLLQVHFNVYHNPNKPCRSVCHICSATVRSGHLKKHMEFQHSETEIEKVQCEICEHWIMKTRMHIHRRKHAMGGVTCKLCGKYLKSYGSLYSHMKIVHENCKNFKCDYCGKAFYKETKLNEHVAVRHTREFLFKCRVPGCGREFRAEGNWKMHERKAHPEEYEKVFAPYYKRAPNEQHEVNQVEAQDGSALPPFSYF